MNFRADVNYVEAIKKRATECNAGDGILHISEISGLQPVTPDWEGSSRAPPWRSARLLRGFRSLARHTR